MSTRRRGLAVWEPRGTQAVVLDAAVVVVGFFAFLLRRPGALTRPILFAEDGPVYFLANLRKGAAALNDAYAGYLVVGPRLGAFVVSLAPLRFTPLGYTLYAAALAVASFALVLSPRLAWHLGGWPLRVLVFAALVGLPQVHETHATLTNVMWFGGIGLLLVALADDPHTRTGRVLEVVVITLVLASGPIGIVFAPAIVWRWWRTRTRWSGFLVGLWGALCVLQLLILRGQHRVVDKGEREVGRLASVLVHRWFGPFAVGADYVQDHLNARVPPFENVAGWSRPHWWLAVLFGALVVGLAAVAHDRGAALVLVAVGALHIVAGFVAAGVRPYLLPDRYAVGSVAAVILIVAGARPLRWWGRVIQGVLVVWALVLWPGNLAVPARSGPSFDKAAQCLATPDQTCTVPVSPDVFNVVIPPDQR